jgi:hypothetical protein
MAAPLPPPATPAPAPRDSRGEAMVAELRWVHDMIRRDLLTVRRLAAQAEAGLPAAAVAAGLRTLAATGPLWQLRVNCLQYCRFVHHHHLAESALLFPALRAASPALSPVVDKLEADHARVSVLLDDVTAAAGELSGAAGASGDADPAARQRLVAALRVLSDELLAHLAYEEENVADTMRGMTGWPGW